MKTRSSKPVGFLSILFLAVGVTCPRLTAQTPAELAVQTYAGLTITGAVGTVYSIEYVTDLTQTNAWRCLEFLQLPASSYLWADKSAPATSKRFYRAVAMEAPTNMVFIPPGTFRMGSPPDEVDRLGREGPQTAVTISRGFWMGKYEATQRDYLEVMGNNPSGFNGVREVWDPGCDCSTNRDCTDLSRPVEMVSWDDATNYCATITQRERAAGRIAANSVYRLPTEAEWEYACRGWTSTRFSYGDDPGCINGNDPQCTNLTNYAWYWYNSDFQTHPVGRKLPNPWGLYDMHGNVWEWCQDWYGEYAGGIALDPQRPVGDWAHVVRSGSYYSGNIAPRSAYRCWGEGSYDNVGFRVVLAPGQP